MTHILRWIGPALVLLGLAIGFWPDGNADATGGQWVAERTWPRGGPIVVVDADADVVGLSNGSRVSVARVLRADGYRVRSGGDNLSRDQISDAQVVVIAQPPERLADARTRRLVQRWLDEGGRALVVRRHRTSPRATRAHVAFVEPAALGERGYVATLLAAMHTLTGVPDS